MTTGMRFPKPNFDLEKMAQIRASGKQPEESDFLVNLDNPEKNTSSKCHASAKVSHKKDIKTPYLGIVALVLGAIGIYFLLAGGFPMVNVNITIISSGPEPTVVAGNAATSAAPLVARSYMDSYKLGPVDVSNLPALSAASVDTGDGSSNTTLTATATSTGTITLVASESTSTVSVMSACGAVSVITITVVSTADAMSESSTGTPFTATGAESTNSGSFTSSSLTSDSTTSSSTTSDLTTSLSTSTGPFIVPVFSNTTTTTTVISTYTVGTGSYSIFPSGTAASGTGTGMIVPRPNNTWVQPIPSARITAISSSTEAAGMSKATTDKKTRTGATVSYCLVMAVMYTVLGIF